MRWNLLTPAIVLFTALAATPSLTAQVERSYRYDANLGLVPYYRAPYQNAPRAPYYYGSFPNWPGYYYRAYEFYPYRAGVYGSGSTWRPIVIRGPVVTPQY